MPGRPTQAESGQALVVVAGIIIALTILGAVVFDVGLAMSDRRNLQSYADAAALAGSRSYTSTSVAGAHWVAMEYLTGPLGFTLPTGSCSSSTTCPAGTYTVSPYTVQLADTTVAGWPYPTALDVVITHQQPGIFSAMIGFGSVNVASSGRAALPAPLLVPSVYAMAAISGNAGVNGGGSGIQTVTGPAYAFGNLGANNGPHSMGIPKVQTDYNGTPCTGSPTNEADFGGGSSAGLAWHWEPSGSGTIGLNKPAPTPFDQYGPTTTGPTYTTAAAAKDASGHWKPGIYNGITPNGGKMNGGVYKIINVSNPTFGNITNTTWTASGTEDTLGAVAIVLDSSDTGTLDIQDMKLNGLDDLHPQAYWGGPRDPEGTHNFVLYGGNGAGGFAGTIDVGPNSTTDLSGIVYLPKVTYSDHGAATIKFTGSATFASMQSSGTANITFNWVCGLNATAAVGNGGGLIR